MRIHLIQLIFQDVQVRPHFPNETRRYSLFTLIISQVRSYRGKTSPIGEDQIYAYSKKVLELNKGMIDNKRNAILRKGISSMTDESLPYIITKKGICSIK